MQNKKKRVKRQEKNIYDVLISPVFWLGIICLTFIVLFYHQGLIDILTAVKGMFPNIIELHLKRA